MSSDKYSELDAMESPMTRLESDMRLSMFKYGFEAGVRDLLYRRDYADADWVKGYETGQAAREAALQIYGALLGR